MGAKPPSDNRDKNPLGPDTYNIKPMNTSSCFSFGTRFDSDIRSKNHVRWKKAEGPGPGSYST